MKFRSSVATAALLLSATFLTPVAVLAEDELYRGPGAHGHPDGRGNRVVGMPGHNGAGGSVVTGNGIDYNGGPVMHGTVKVYFIWYGDWSQDPAASGILSTWASSIGGTPYENINSTYGDANGNVSGLVSFAGSTVSTSNFGNLLNDSNIASIVSNALTSHAIPTDTNAVYFVLTAPGVGESSGFLSQYCGWHTYGTLSGSNIKYAFVGDAGTQSGCSVQFGKSPNNDPPIDAMISVMSHELEESISDPNLNAWYSDANGQENADMCAWNFGAQSTAPNGSSYNMTFGNNHYLIQQNWLNANGGGCVQAWASTPDFSLSASPASSLTITQGAAGNSTVTATSLSGFTGAVGLTLAGCPTGATCSLSSTSVNPPANGTTTSTLTITTTASTNTGPFTVTVTGTSGTAHTTTVSGTVNTPPVPNFSMSASPTTLTLTQGTGGNSTVTVTSVNSFNSPVNLVVSGCPTGANCTLNSTSITPPSNSSAVATLTVSTGTAMAGNYTLTITGTGESLVHSTTVMLKINGPVPDFTISATPSSQTITRGSSTSYTVTIGAVNSFTGAVNLSVSGLPSRASSSFSPNSVTGSGTSTMTVTTNSKGKTGNSTLTIKGTSGSLSHTTTVTLTIN